MNLNLQGLPSRSVAIRASRMVTPKVAKVIISYSGKVTPDYIASEISKSLNGLGSVVESSFHPIEVDGYTSTNLAVGYVRTNREVRMPTKQEMQASYKVLSSNILMSNEDRSLWEVKKGKNTTYLARHGTDDLSGLLDLCTAKVSVMSSETHALQASVMPQKYDVITFVNEMGDCDFGFVLAANDVQTKVVAYSTKSARVIPNASVMTSCECKIDPLLAKAVKRRVMANTQDGSTADMEAYYRELFSYDPQYMQEFLDAVKEMTKSIA